MTGPFSFSLSLGLAGNTGGGVNPPPAALLAAGATWGVVGDGLMDSGSGVGPGGPNAPHNLMRRMNGRIQAVPLPILAKSGTTIARDISSNRQWINPFAIDAMAKQLPDYFILGSMGANDNLLSTDPGADASSGHTTNVYLQDWYDAVDYAYGKFTAYVGKLFVVVGTVPSAKTGEATYRSTVWAAMAAHVAAMALSDPKVLYVDLSGMLPMTDYSIDATNFVHDDERGGEYVANAIFLVLDPKIEAKTADQIVDMIDAGTYPLQLAANGDADTGLTGTGGTLTGPGITAVGGSGLATSKAVTNTTGATGITVEQVATSGGRTKTRINLAGTATGNGKVMLQDKTSISISATPGQYVRTGFIVRGPVSARNWGSEWNNNGGFWGAGATSMANNALSGANPTRALDALIINGTNGGGVGTLNFGSSTALAGKRSFALWFMSGQVLSGSMEMERPFSYKPSNRLAGTMYYIGDVATSVAKMMGNNYRLRPTGTISQAAGGTIRVEPGQWNLFGLTEADFATRRIYKGTVSDTAVGSGTKMGNDMTGSTWTQTFGAAAVTTGDLIYVEITDREGNTYRSGVTVTAT